MKFYKEESLDNFEAWSGGKDTLDTLIEKVTLIASSV